MMYWNVHTGFDQQRYSALFPATAAHLRRHQSDPRRYLAYNCRTLRWNYRPDPGQPSPRLPQPLCSNLIHFMNCTVAASLSVDLTCTQLNIGLLFIVVFLLGGLVLRSPQLWNESHWSSTHGCKVVALKSSLQLSTFWKGFLHSQPKQHQWA